MGLFDTKQQSESESRLWGWGPAMPGVRKAAGITGKRLKRPLRFFPGQTYAGQTDAEAEAIAQLQAGASAYPGLLASLMEPGMAAWQNAIAAPQAALQMGLQDVMNNPALQGAAESVTGQLTRNLTDNILPGLTQQFMGYGGLGGTRQGVAEGLAVDRTQQAIADSLAGMYGNAWSQGLNAETSRYLAGLNAQQGAFGQMPGLASLGLSEFTQPAGLLQQAGGLERADQQRAIDEAMSRWDFQQYEPFRRAGLGLGLLMDPAAQFGTRTGKNEVQGHPSTWSNIGNVLGTGAMTFGGMGGIPGMGAPTPSPLSGGYSGPMYGPWNTYARGY